MRTTNENPPPPPHIPSSPPSNTAHSAYWFLFSHLLSQVFLFRREKSRKVVSSSLCFSHLFYLIFVPSFHTPLFTIAFSICPSLLPWARHDHGTGDLRPLSPAAVTGPWSWAKSWAEIGWLAGEAQRIFPFKGNKLITETGSLKIRPPAPHPLSFTLFVFLSFFLAQSQGHLVRAKTLLCSLVSVFMCLHFSVMSAEIRADKLDACVCSPPCLGLLGFLWCSSCLARWGWPCWSGLKTPSFQEIEEGGGESKRTRGGENEQKGEEGGEEKRRRREGHRCLWSLLGVTLLIRAICSLCFMSSLHPLAVCVSQRTEGSISLAGRLSQIEEGDYLIGWFAESEDNGEKPIGRQRSDRWILLVVCLSQRTNWGMVAVQTMVPRSHREVVWQQ